MMIKYDKNLEYDNSPCDVGETRTNSSDVKLTNLKEPFMEYIYGVHCGDKDCYSCGTQRYNCEELNQLDLKTDEETDELDKSAEPTDKELSEIEDDFDFDFDLEDLI